MMNHRWKNHGRRLLCGVVIGLFLPAIVLNGQQAGGSNAGGNSGGGNSGGGGGASQAGGGGGASSNLQSESKVVIFNALSECVDGLIEKMHENSDVQHNSAFVLTLPFTPDDAASCWELKRQLVWLNAKLGKVPKPPALDTKLKSKLDAGDALLAQLRMDYRDPSGGAAAGNQGASTSTSIMPDISELAGLGSSFTQFGTILSTLSSAVQLAETFHSSFTTSSGALGLSQQAVNSIVVNELTRRGYKVVDFSQYYIPENAYSAGKKPPGDLNHDTILDLMNAFRDNIDTLDGYLMTLQNDENAAKSQATNADQDAALLASFNAANTIGSLKNVNGTSAPKWDQTKVQKVADAIKDLKDASATWKAMPTNDTGYTKGVTAILSAATTFEQVLTGSVDPKYPLASNANSNSGGGGLSGTNTVATVTQPGGTVTTVNLVTSSNNSTTGNGNSGQGGNGGGNNNSAAAIPTSSSPSINLIEKYALLEQYLQRMDNEKIKLISAQVLVGDATQATVTRALLENYVAISGRAVVELQVFDPLQGEYDYSDHQEADHQYVYFPSRIRDGAENKWKDRDLLSHPRDVPGGDLNWYTRFDQARVAAGVQDRPILVEFVNSARAPFPVTSDSEIFNDNDLRAFATTHLILDRYDVSLADKEYQDHNLGISGHYRSRVHFLLYDPGKKTFTPVDTASEIEDAVGDD